VNVSRPLVRRMLGVGILSLVWCTAPVWEMMVATAVDLTPQDHMERGGQAFERGDIEGATRAWREAARLYERARQPVARSVALTRLAQAYEALGLYNQAASSLETAQELAVHADDQQQLATILANLGNLHVATGPPDKAERLLHDALQLSRTHGDAGLEAVILNNLGNLSMSHRNPQAPAFAQALDFYRHSASVAQQARHPAMAARALTHAAMATIDLQQAQETQTLGQESLLHDALALLEQAMATMPHVASTHAKAYDLINIGQTYHRVANALPDADLVLQAAAVLQEAAELAQTLHDSRALTYVWGTLGRLYEEAQRYQEALTLTRRAVLAAQQVHVPDALYQWQWQTGRLLRAMGDRDGAIAAYQRAVKTLQGLRAELPQAYGRVHTDFRTTLGPLYFELVDLLLQRAAAVADPAQVSADLYRVQDTVEQFKQAELQEYLGDACVAAARPRHVALAEVARVASQTAVIVYPILLPDRTELLVGLPTGLTRFPVAVGADTLISVATAFREALQGGSERLYRRYAQQLYTWLIRPFEQALTGPPPQTLVFVPDGVLRTIPLAALHDGQQFLVEKYALAVTPGLQLTDPQPLARATLQVLAAGVSAPASPGFASLPHVTRELEAIQRFFPGRVQVLPEFRRTELESALHKRQFGIVHIASHGRFAHHVADSFLLTADAQDNKLTLTQLKELIGRGRFREEPLELLTLSACETALGDDRAALGLAGIAIQAGARSVLATLWRVEDAATAVLMTAFYEHLQTREVSRAQALQQAQIRLLQQPQYADPFFWAPFLLINNWL
jgi:CHAT domain-containing protein